MNTITKIISLVSIIAIIVSAVAIGLNLNTTQQTSQLNAQLNPTPTPTATPRPRAQIQITKIGFTYGNNISSADGTNTYLEENIVVSFTSTDYSNSVVSVLINGTSYNQNIWYSGETYDTCDITLGCTWQLNQSYTITLTFNEGQTLTTTATPTQQTIYFMSVTATAPTATPAPQVTTYGQILNVTFVKDNSDVPNPRNYIDITTNLDNTYYITSLTINGVQMQLGDENGLPYTGCYFNWINGTSYTIQLMYKQDIVSTFTDNVLMEYVGNCTYTATSPLWTPTPQPSPSPTPTPPLSVSFSQESSSKVILLTFNVMVNSCPNIIDVTVNGVNCYTSLSGQSGNVQYLSYNWQSGESYTITVTTSTNQILSITATAP